MGKISKLFNGELKKIFLSIGIFLMSLFLILTLTISPKLFNPTEKQDITTLQEVNSNNVKGVYDSFISKKGSYISEVTNLENVYTDLILSNENFKQNLIDISTSIYNSRTTLNSLIVGGSTVNQKLNCLNTIIAKLSEYKSTYNDYLNNHFLPLILLNEDLDFDISFEIETMEKILNQDGNKATEDYYILINDSLENYGCAYNLMNLSSKINNLTYSNENLQNFLNSYQHKKDEYRNNLQSDLLSYNTQATANDDFNNSYENILHAKDLTYSYFASYYNYSQMLQNNLYLEISQHYTDGQLSNFIKFEGFNSYKVKESYTKYLYLFENDYSDSNFSNVFSFNNSSSSTSKTFDYMYFTLEISSFLIILFTVIIGANIVAKEYSSGTIKLLVMRPFSRNKIIFAKVLATLFFGFIFTLITGLVALITGCILFGGVSSSTVLMVINANTILTLPIWAEFLIYWGCLLVKIWVFSLLAIAISIIFKSNLLAVCLSALLYLVNLLVTFIAKGATWLKYNIFANLDLFKYFGGSFNSHYTINENLTNLLSSSVIPDTNILFPIIIISSLVVVLNIIIFTVFKHRDI